MTEAGSRIGLLSDIHATPDPVLDALRIFREQYVETILCAGDIAGYGRQLGQTVDLLIENDCQTVAGNHDLWFFEREGVDTVGPSADYLRSLPATINVRVQGKELFMVHASPPDSVMAGIRLLDEEGALIKAEREAWAEALSELNADVLVVGHTHQVYAEQLGETLVINPGSTLFNHTCAILTLPEMTVDFYPLCGREPVLSWNFSMFKGFEF